MWLMPKKPPHGCIAFHLPYYTILPDKQFSGSMSSGRRPVHKGRRKGCDACEKLRKYKERYYGKNGYKKKKKNESIGGEDAKDTIPDKEPGGCGAPAEVND